MLEKLFKKTKYISLNSVSEKTFIDKSNAPNIPDGMYVICKKCDLPIYKDDLESSNYICDKCNYHFRLKPIERIAIIADEGSFIHYFEDINTSNPLEYEGYEEKLLKEASKSLNSEAVTTGICTIDGMKIALGVMDPSFMMGSMGSVVGEKLTLLIEKATLEKLPLVLITASGGARMQEGIFSLMQMAKTSMALKRHSNEGNLYISILTDPTTGGVTASFAMLGDIIISEPKALIGFAGPRVIEQTIRQKLPEGFQRAEFLLEHGFIDKIIEREEIRTNLSMILKLHGGKCDNCA